jgi:hypothetical protein
MFKYAIIQWETAAFYTFDAESGGAPIPFGSPGYYDQATQMKVGITRLGSSVGEARVKWKTFDMSAEAYKHYVPMPYTEVVFEDGCSHKDVYVSVIPTPGFEGTVEFGLFIDKQSVENAAVGKYLHTSSVKIIDSNAFPSDAIRENCVGGDLAKIMEVAPFTLVYHFVELCFQLTARGSYKVLFAHVFDNLRVVLNTFIMFYVIETLSSGPPASSDDAAAAGCGGSSGSSTDDGSISIDGVDDDDDDDSGVTYYTDKEKTQRIFIFGMLWIFPFAGTHLLAYHRVRYWGIAGQLRQHLQVILLKKFLNYTDESRNKVPVGQLVMSMVRDVTNSVVDGYLVTIDMLFGTFPRSKDTPYIHNPRMTSLTHHPPN